MTSVVDFPDRRVCGQGGGGGGGLLGLQPTVVLAAAELPGCLGESCHLSVELPFRSSNRGAAREGVCGQEGGIERAERVSDLDGGQRG